MMRHTKSSLRTVFSALTFLSFACGDSEQDGTSSSASTAGGTGAGTAASTGSGLGGQGGEGVGGEGAGGGPPVGSAACLSSGWCWIAPSVDGSGFIATTIDDNGHVWFSGTGKALLRWDGTEFHRYEPDAPTPSTLEHSFFVIDEDHIFIGQQHYDGTAWTLGPDVIGRLDDGTLIGRAPNLQLMVWDGAAWVAAPQPPLAAEHVHAWGASVDDFRLLADNGAVQLYQSGGWAALEAGRGWDLDPPDVIELDDGTIAVLQRWVQPMELQFFENDSWTLATALPTVHLFAGTAKDDIVIYSSAGTDRRMHWDGVQLTELGPYDGIMIAAAAAPDGTIYEAGGYGLLRTFDDGIVTSLQEGPFPGDADIYRYDNIFEPPFGGLAWIGDRLWVGTDNAEVVRYDGTAWDSIQLTQGRVHAIWGSSANDVWFAGDAFVEFDNFDYPSYSHAIHHFDGTNATLSYQDPVSNDHLIGAWGTGPSDVYVWGLKQSLHYDGSTWAPATGLARHGTGPDNVWVATPSALEHFDGTSWTSYAFFGPDLTRALYSFGPGDVWANQGNDLYAFNGSVLLQKPLPPEYDAPGNPLLYLRTAADQHAVFLLHGLWTFTGDNPMNGTLSPLPAPALTVNPMKSAVADSSGKLYVRVDGGVLKQQ